jgi:heat shock protein HtpX
MNALRFLLHELEGKMNYFKTALLLAALTALFGGVGYLIAGEQGMFAALVMAGVMNLVAWWFSDKILLGMYGAKQLTSGGLYDTVSSLARGAGLSMPKVYLIETEQPNAFATGRSPASAAVAVTRGLINLLDARELRAVVAHEMAHIKNHDTLIMTITATLAGALGMLANFAMFSGDRRDQPGGALGTLAVVILAPLAAMLVQFAISRTREYAADRIGAKISRDPLALASALEKIERVARQTDNYMAEQNPATAHLFIINPLHMRSIDNLFSTHPSTENRVQALREMASGAHALSEGPWQHAA